MNQFLRDIEEYVELTNELLAEHKSASVPSEDVRSALEKLASAGFIRNDSIGTLAQDIASDPSRMVDLLVDVAERAVPKADFSLGKVADNMPAESDMDAEEKLFQHFNVPFTRKQ